MNNEIENLEKLRLVIKKLEKNMKYNKEYYFLDLSKHIWVKKNKKDFIKILFSNDFRKNTVF